MHNNFLAGFVLLASLLTIQQTWAETQLEVQLTIPKIDADPTAVPQFDHHNANLN